MTKRDAVTFWCNVAMCVAFPKVVEEYAEEAFDALDRDDHEGVERAGFAFDMLIADVEEYVPVGAC